METITWSAANIQPNARTLLYAIQSKRCNNCHNEFLKQDLTVDHIKPLAQGGDGTLTNKQLLCIDCHRGKTILDTAVTLALRVVKRYEAMAN
jgi:5-methylcytosine-specific restriction endonuclease McrA